MGALPNYRFGNIDLGVLVFRLINALVHILNCYIIYKIWGKRAFVLMYGLHPLVLIEGISNAHNDMFVLLFILMATYMVIKRKDIILSSIFLSLAASVKYFAILLLPVFVLYHYRDKKLPIRILLGGMCILLFAVFVLAYYFPFIQDMDVFKGMETQQEKLGKSFYITLRLMFPKARGLTANINKILTLTFIILYFIKCVDLLFKKKIDIKKEMREHVIYLMSFLFLLITNFQPWYLMWLFYAIFWQKKETAFYLINICFAALLANSVFLIYTEAWQNGGVFSNIMLTSIVGLILIGKSKKMKKLYEEISFN